MASFSPWRRLMTAAVASLVLPIGLAATGSSVAATAPRPSYDAPTRAAAGNPLAGHPMGVYFGPADLAYEPYLHATPIQQQLLDRFVKQPKAQWYGRFTPNKTVAKNLQRYISTSQDGDPDKLVQMTFFRVDPWEAPACHQLPSAAQKASFKQWMDTAASAIGDAPTAIILQPDGPFALCAPHGSLVASHLVAYAARVLSALPHTSVYIDAGSADWNRNHVSVALQILLRGGVRYARGFALGASHYDTTADEVRYGAHIVRALTSHGVPGKRFVVDTSDNGQGFTGAEWRAKHPGQNYNNAVPCSTKTQRLCLTLGIPPTTDVANRAWGLPPNVARAAALFTDAYLWFGRPWINDNTGDFSMKRALAVARTTPYQ